MTESPQTTPAHILVVDDEGSICRLVASLLEAHGHTVVKADSGQTALALAAGSDRPIDLLVTDVRMKGMDGINLARALGRRYAGMKIIFMSGFFGEEVGLPDVSEGNWEFISKPFSLPHLMSLVQRALHGMADAAPS